MILHIVNSSIFYYDDSIQDFSINTLIALSKNFDIFLCYLFNFMTYFFEGN